MSVVVTLSIIGILAGIGTYHYFIPPEERTWQGYVTWAIVGGMIGAAVGYGAYQFASVVIPWIGTSSPMLAKSWQEAEKVIMKALHLADKNTTEYFMNGRWRIPDFIDHGRHFIADVKFYGTTLPATQQLRDFAVYALEKGYRLYVFVRTDTPVTQNLVDLVKSTGGNIIRLLVSGE
jgi:hypothetical protein